MDAFSNLLKEGFKDLFKDELKEIVKEALRELSLEKGALMQGRGSDTTLLDRKEAAKLLRISLPTLDQYSKEGIIIGRRIGKKIVYRKDEVLNAGKSVTLLKYRRKSNI
jgi:hypothetical protein